MLTVFAVAFFAASTFAKAPSKLPDYLSEELFCSGCKATLKELDKILSKTSSVRLDDRITSALEDICTDDNFRVYEYIPPKMIKACNYIIENYEDELERLLKEHYSSKPRQPFTFLEKNLCRLVTRACLQIEEKKAEEEKQKAKIKMKGEEKEFEMEFGEFSKIPDNAKVASPSIEEHDDPIKFEQKIEVFDESVVESNDKHSHTEL